MFNPYTGTPRHPSDIASDPEGVLILEPGEPIKAAPKTNAERQADLKARRIAAGLVPVTNLWAHPEDVEAIRDHAAKLARRRERAAKRAAP